jgi:hypothetical protein
VVSDASCRRAASSSAACITDRAASGSIPRQPSARAAIAVNCVDVVDQL